MTVRSYLYVPGDQPRKLARAFERGADALIADLEDAVAPSAKAEARQSVARWLENAVAPAGAQVWVRINPVGSDDTLAAMDISAVTAPGLTGICIPKCSFPGQVAAVAAMVAAAEQHAGIQPGTIRLAPIVESAQGLLAASDIAQGPHVDHLHLGEADLVADLGLRPGASERELMPARWQVVLASAAARLDAPVGPVCRFLGDPCRLRASTRRLRRLGFGGRAVIHPEQISVVNEIFTPSAAEEAAARALIARFESAGARGGGVITDGHQMIDEAVIRTARRTVRLAQMGHVTTDAPARSSQAGR